MKTVLRILLVGLTSFMFISAAYGANYLSVTADNANVRTGPGTNYPVSMELFKGYPLRILKQQGEWYKIKDFENDEGWIHRSIVKGGDTVIVNAKKSVNMRSGPSTKNAIIADVERGVVLVKLATKGKWTKVQHSSSTTGWVYSPLLWP